MNEKNAALAVGYYQAMSNKDLIAVEKYLHPDVHLISPFIEKKGKQDVLDAVNNLMNFFRELTIRESFGSQDQAMLAYDLDFPEPIGKIRTAVLLTFQDGLIKRYELFFDTSPFKQK
jgi:ketosteroid isomerase-like protein